MNPQTDLDLFIPHTRQGEYLTLPFEVPEGTAEMTLTYSYQRHTTSQAPAGLGEFERSEKINTIDLGLLSPDGRQVGAAKPRVNGADVRLNLRGGVTLYFCAHDLLAVLHQLLAAEAGVSAARSW